MELHLRALRKMLRHSESKKEKNAPVESACCVKEGSQTQYYNHSQKLRDTECTVEGITPAETHLYQTFIHATLVTAEQGEAGPQTKLFVFGTTAPRGPGPPHSRGC
jgi:hypothetical protein